MLLDVALLDIFDFYLGNTYEKQAWQTLVHVCRNWRNVVFGSPRRLNLRLVCRDTTPARETLDVWPLLPIIIWAHFSTTLDAGNIIAALERNDRVCKMDIFDVPSSGAEKVLAALQQPFPALTDLRYGFQFQKEITPGVRASFLGGPSPGLQTRHSRHSQICSIGSGPRGGKCQRFVLRSWVDLHQVCKHSGSMAFHFRNYQCYF
jgi:hypothetical protein